MRHLRNFAATAGAAALALAGCEVIVGRDLPAFACTPGDETACAVGQVCSPAGVCVASCPATPCEQGTVCETATHLCVPTGGLPEGGREGGASDGPSPGDSPGGRDALVGDANVDNTTDSPSGPADVGDPCPRPDMCRADLVCGTDAVLGDAVRSTGPLCTKPCCKSEDCAAGFVCYGPGTGGTYCVRPELLQRKSANGASKGGTSCTRGESCRSGVCLGPATNMVCADTCCSDADCAAPSLCRRTLVEGHNVFACGIPPAGATGNDTSCIGSVDCNSGVCVVVGAFAYCKPHACGKTACLAQRPPSSGYGTSAYLQTAGAPEYLGLCLHNAENPGGPPGTASVGTTCTDGTDCLTAFCDPGSKKCTDVCCVDNDCSMYAGTQCRPSSNPHYLTCQ
jgi:hypothetical protein